MFTTTFVAAALTLASIFTGVATASVSEFATATPITLEQSTAITASNALSQDEIDALLFMREEEKLAHDVYMTLYEEWGMRIFTNIAASEQTHTDAVATLLARYGIADPTLGNEVGEFSDPALQELYDQLVVQGSASLEGALQVGAAIEEIDILDLEERIAETDQADIRLVYSNLLAGSKNHLNAFVSTFERQTGTSYTPQYMEQADYDAIMASAAAGKRGAGRSGESSGGGRGTGRGGRW